MWWGICYRRKEDSDFVIDKDIFMENIKPWSEK